MTVGQSIKSGKYIAKRKRMNEERAEHKSVQIVEYRPIDMK